MADVSTVEGELILSDGVKLYTKTWKTVDPPKAILVFIHGFSDHCNAYGDFFPILASKGIELRSFDQRGWGRSVQKPSEKGLTGPTTLVISDITAFIKTCLPSSAPLFLMGHSMGGAQVLTWIAQGPADVKKQIRGYLLEAPFVAFHPATKPSQVTVVVGRLAGKLLPRHQMVFKLDEKLLSRDPACQKAFVEDKLCHDTGTLEGMAGMLDRAAGLDTGKIRIPKDACENSKTSIWLSHGNKDGVCDYHGTERVYNWLDASDDKELKIYDGWFHKLHAEPSPYKETYAEDAANWIFARCGPLDKLVRSRI